MTTNEIRKKYLSFFVKQGHKEIPAAGLLAENDPTLLFVNSGMFPLVPYLMGQKHPAGKRLVNVQRSFRTDDISEVGDHRHNTFFEMIGNWSLGDYFKKEQLNWWYQFLVEEVGLDINKLYQTVFSGTSDAPKDEESIVILKDIYKKYGIEAGVYDQTLDSKNVTQEVPLDGSIRIFPYIDKNWWKRGDAIGELGGPDSETFYDTGKKHDPKYGQHCNVNCDCGRFLEIGNSVFMEFKKTAQGWERMAQRNVDFGGGLERIAMVSQQKDNIFETDGFAYIVEMLTQKSGKSYIQESRAFEVICDHARALVFLIADGGRPSNKDQGYFVRRLLRRCLVFLQKLGLEQLVLSEIANAVVDHQKQVYPYLAERADDIMQVIAEESDRFGKTLNTGMKHFEEVAKKGSISGQDAFVLYTTYGFPIELITELAAEKKLALDEKTLQSELEKHQELSRAGAQQKFKGGLADTQEQTIKMHTATHLLHEALKQVLGEHVQQKGSNITVERLRFDFSHPQKVTKEELTRVEQIVNEQIQKALSVFCEELTPQQARDAGATGLFEEKYGDKVTVYSIGASIESGDKAFSREFCGGPHVKNTKDIGGLKIVKEEAVSAGIRRIKAVIV